MCVCVCVWGGEAPTWRRVLGSLLLRVMQKLPGTLLVTCPGRRPATAAFCAVLLGDQRTSQEARRYRVGGGGETGVMGGGRVGSEMQLPSLLT